MEKWVKLVYTGILTGALLACETRTTTTGTTVSSENGDTAIVIKTDTKASRELDEFKAWVSNKADRADSSAKENWPEVKAEFKARSARLDNKMDSLSAETKAEYAELKAEYKAWEAKNEQREKQPLNQAKIQQWQQELLGGNKNLASLTGADMRETYLLFMGIVRAKKGRWTQDDWDYVDYVYSQLNNQKQAVESAISSGDRIKIKTLQAEYLALEAGSDAKDLYQHVKK